MKKLADGLKIHARRLGLSDAEVARRAQLSDVRYGHYARGRSEPDLATLLRICKVLGVTPNDLLLDAPEKSKKDESAILRSRIKVNLGLLGKRQLRMLGKVIDGLLS